MKLLSPQILHANVIHKRLFPKENGFDYGIYYILLPLSRIAELPIAYNRPAALSFYDRDHGACDGSNLEGWARDILAEYNISEAVGEITLICMPRIFGYVFNPVSFWLCHDHEGGIRALLCEVHNTFGEKHTYLCAHEDHSSIGSNDILEAKKLFHVSPFLKREGHYTFRFSASDKKLGAWIDFYDADGKKQLITSLVGNLQPMSKRALRQAFWGYPLVTLKAIVLIHWQAFKLVFKGIKYISKPEQFEKKLSVTDKLTKM